MNYTDLRRGDKLPSVGVLQKLLNRTGASLAPDGEFGQKTETAVRVFQRAHRLNPDGIVGKDTWPRLATGSNLRIVDCIDVFDPSLFNLEAQDVGKAGGNPILIGGMCNGVEAVVSAIVSASAGGVFLLRFHGHGAPGVAGVSFGQGAIGWGERADIDLSNFATLRPALARLRSIFGPYGNVQFMHCSTGSGPNGRRLLQSIGPYGNVQFMHCSTGSGPNGRRLLQSIADTLGVPATAALQTQYGGGVATFKYEGPTYTALTGGAVLRGWCRALPDFAGMSIA